MSQPTLGELDQLFRNDMSEGGRQFFTTEAVTGWLNEAQDFIVAEELYMVRGTWRRWSVPYATTYLLPEDLLAPESLYARNSTGQPYRVDFEDGLAIDRRTYMGVSTAVGQVVNRVTYSHPAEGMAAEIYPALSIYTPLLWVGPKRLKRLVNALDRTECPASLCHVLVHYAVMLAKMKDEEVRQADQWDARVTRDVREIQARAMREAASDRNQRGHVARRGRRFGR